MQKKDAKSMKTLLLKSVRYWYSSLIYKYSTEKALIPVVIGPSQSNAMWEGGGGAYRPQR
jgi:hypothetical protein